MTKLPKIDSIGIAYKVGYPTHGEYIEDNHYGKANQGYRQQTGN
jgi:hypothetical protein